MSTVTVTTREDVYTLEATDWFVGDVDPHGDLHVYSEYPSNIVATFARGEWLNVIATPADAAKGAFK